MVSKSCEESFFYSMLIGTIYFWFDWVENQRLYIGHVQVLNKMSSHEVLWSSTERSPYISVLSFVLSVKCEIHV